MKQSVINCCDSHRYGNEVNASTSSILWQKRKQYCAGILYIIGGSYNFEAKIVNASPAEQMCTFTADQKWCANPGIFFVFRHFLNTMKNTVQNLMIKSVDGMLGIWTWDHKIVDVDESTELWRPPPIKYLFMMRQMCKGLVKTLTRYCQYNTPASYFFFDAVPITVFNLTTTY